MQALRLASFMSQPTLLGIQTLVMLGPYLTNSGRFLDAWTLFGTTIRVAHSIGLHRNPKVLEPSPPLRECMIRQTLWWWMLHMDQQYSVTLGRPLGISGYGDCPPPAPLTTNPTILRLGEFVDHFTILARQILSSDGLMVVQKIDEYTDKLVGLWDTMPASLQFNESWLWKETPLPEWPLEVMSATLFAKVQSFLILLNRQRVERTQSAAGTSPPEFSARPHTSAATPTGATRPYYTADHQLLHPAPLRGRALVINSSLSLLHTFLFCHHRQPAVLISWTIGQQAFNACMNLILDAWETENEHNEWLVSEAFAVFTELNNNGVHKLASLAVDRISGGIAALGHRRDERRRTAQALSRRQSQQSYVPLIVDTAAMPDWAVDSVMSNTGMFLLEDPGLQSYTKQSFQPLGWQMAGSGSAHPSSTSRLPSPEIPPGIPVTQITPGPFPIMSPPYNAGGVPVAVNSPYTLGLQPRMPTLHRRPGTRQLHSHAMPPQPQLNVLLSSREQHQQHLQAQLQAQQLSFTQARTAPRHNNVGVGPRGVHKLDRPAQKPLQRRMK